ncbi:hypothetical protein QPK87_23560 [Kamptonema cortianum]|nr:hypothetical protein [Kamptonema cortianum]
MKNEVSKKIIRHRIVPLITLMFLSSSTAVLAESPPKGNVNTQFSGQQVIENKAPQQKKHRSYYLYRNSKWAKPFFKSTSSSR